MTNFDVSDKWSPLQFGALMRKIQSNELRIIYFSFYKIIDCKHVSRLMTKPTKWHVCPAKTQISLGICPVWSEASLSAWRKLGSLATYWAHYEDWSDWADVQADPSLCWVHNHFVGFVMRRLICIWMVMKMIFIWQTTRGCSWHTIVIVTVMRDKTATEQLS